MLQLLGVHKHFAGNGDKWVEVLNDVSLSFGKGELVCLLGPSGCGKSTLLNLIAGFIRPTSGCLLFEERQIAGPGPDRGVIFQEPTLFPWLTAVQNVAFGLQNAKVPRNERRVRALQGLEKVGLGGFADARPHALSGGMRQRVALARVLVLEPRLLLMDEPFSALDENTRERLQDELLRLWQTDRKTIVFVTHNVDEAAYLADRVLVMGPPPRSLVADIPVDLARPRKRGGLELQMITDRLRLELIGQPCCIPSTQRRKTEKNDGR